MLSALRATPLVEGGRPRVARYAALLPIESSNSPVSSRPKLRRRPNVRRFIPRAYQNPSLGDSVDASSAEQQCAESLAPAAEPGIAHCHRALALTAGMRELG